MFRFALGIATGMIASYMLELGMFVYERRHFEATRTVTPKPDPLSVMRNGSP